jgi:peptide/nickel transport system substrate-binding protein
VKYAYDPRQAVQLIEGLGYKRGGDGSFGDASGGKLSVELRTSADNTARVRALSAVADDWRQVGVGVQETVMPSQLQGDREYRATRCCFEINRGGTALDFVDAYHSDGVRTAANRFRGNGRTHNYPRYANPDLDALIERFDRTIPMAERLQVVGQILQHMTSQVVQMGMYYDVQPVMVHNRLGTNFVGFTWNAHEWDLS